MTCNMYQGAPDWGRVMESTRQDERTEGENVNNRRVQPVLTVCLGLLVLINPVLALLKLEGTFGRLGWLRLTFGVLLIAVGLYRFIRAN